MARPQQACVGDARRPAAAARQFQGGVVGDRRLQLAGVDLYDLRQLLDGVKLQVFLPLEAVAHRAGQHAAARRGADQGEPLQTHRDRPGAEALAEHDVDAEVFHRRVDELLDDARHAVDFVDEEDRAFFEVGQERQQVGRLGQGGAARHLDRRAQFVGQHGREGRLAEPGRAVEEDVGQRFLEFLAGVQDDAEALHHRFLADDLAQPARPQRGVALAPLVATAGLDHGLTGHVALQFSVISYQSA